MAFRPFGESFDFKSPSALSDVKATIRSRKKDWFDPSNGARGWIVGSVICLWFSAFDRHGPMLVGWISHDASGSRVRGQAGSNLHGLVLSMLFIPLVMGMVGLSGSLAMTVALLAIVSLISALVFLTSHVFRKDAEPLARFLKDAVAASDRPLAQKSQDQARSRSLRLSVSGQYLDGPLTPTSIRAALLGLGAGDFGVMESGPETYIQTFWCDGNFEVEKREGDRPRHFKAERNQDSPATTGEPETAFKFEEMLAVFLAYASEAPSPRFLKWKTMRLPD